MSGGRGPGRGTSSTLASAVARQIEQEIIDRGWPVWEALGTEPALLERYGVSRSVFREAVRILEHRQLVVTRRGPGGGLFVGAPASEVVVEAIAVSFEFAAVSVDELFEARKVVETLALQLTCARATSRELATLALDPRPLGGLHARIARLSGNAAVPLFLDSLLALTNERVLERLDAQLDGLPHGHDDAHEDLRAAIVDRDVEKATLVLEDHLDMLSAWVASQPARVLDDGAPTYPGREPTTMKLPERIARQIRQQILRNRWRDGHVIGSEHDLLAEFGVSRNVLREAVRILEHHRIASMRRGIGGGLIVRTPDPTLAIEAAATYLDYLHIQESHLHELRDGIEAATTALAARRITPEGAARLHAHLEAELNAPDFNLAAVGLHVLLAEMSANRALHFFTSVLMRLQAEHSPPPEEARPGEEAAAEINRAHRSIVDAVVAGDAALAVRRMGRHVGAVMPYVDVTYRRK